MRTPVQLRLYLAIVFVVMLISHPPFLQAGIPEPSHVLYGVVRHVESNVRVTVGPIQWIFEPLGGGDPVVVSGTLSNINDQFYYVLFVPMETPLAGEPAAPNTLQLTAAPTTYDRSQVLINGEPASLVTPALGLLNLTRADRGKMDRIDLTVATVPADSDGNGLPDDWEMSHFNQIGIDAEADSDGDGLTNREEWKAGTDPTDAQSQFAFIEITVDAGVTIRWSSVEGRTYQVLRSVQLTGPFAPIAVEVPATPPVNSYQDDSAAAGTTYFYRLSVEEQ